MRCLSEWSEVPRFESPAVRRQRVEQSPSDVFVHRLLGIRLDEEQVRSGKQFVQGVVDRVGDDAAIAMLLTGNDRCPTPSEIARLACGSHGSVSRNGHI